MIYLETNLGTSAAKVKWIIIAEVYCILFAKRFGKLIAVICSVKHGLIVLISKAYIFQNLYIL